MTRRTFTPKQDQPEQQASSILGGSKKLASEENLSAASSLQVHRPVGHQPAPRLLKAQPDGLAVESSTGAARFSHDFSRIPMYSQEPVKDQKNLTVSNPEDAREKEAGRVVPQRMHTAKPHLAPGASSPSYSSPKPGSNLWLSRPGDPWERQADRMAEEVLQATERPPAGASGTAPSLLGRQSPGSLTSPGPAERMGSAEAVERIEGLRGTGSPLPPAERAFFEPRLGRDLGHVRLHGGAEAAKLARTFEARAFTVGHDLFFAAGELQQVNKEGRSLLAHELVHVLQQEGRPANCEPMIQRTTQHTIGKGKKAMTFVVGELEFSANAKDDILKQGGLLPGPDQAHIAFIGLKLGYDVNYTTPQDPFRWNIIKDLVDSDEKINVDKVGLTDTIKIKFVTPTDTKIIEDTLTNAGAQGLTLPTESKLKAIHPTDATFTCSPHDDMHQVYYSAAISSSAATSELAHELLGHMWLAIKGVPFGHPKDKERIKTHGTLATSHGIKDPLGQTFSGKVETFISEYITSQSIAAFSSPTQFVGPQLLTQALTDFKDGFTDGASGTLNEPYVVSDQVALEWEKISNNYRFAPSASTGSTVSTTSPGDRPPPHSRPSSAT
jgi:Domain of unknown function (DUF4157)